MSVSGFIVLESEFAGFASALVVVPVSAARCVSPAIFCVSAPSPRVGPAARTRGLRFLGAARSAFLGPAPVSRVGFPRTARFSLRFSAFAFVSRLAAFPVLRFASVGIRSASLHIFSAATPARSFAAVLFSAAAVAAASSHFKSGTKPFPKFAFKFQNRKNVREFKWDGQFKLPAKNIKRKFKIC